MTIHQALVIPPAMDDRLELVDFDDSDPLAVNKLVFADGHGILTGATFSKHNIQIMYDDEGLYNTPDQMNRRAMLLFATLSGHQMQDFVVPLVGTYVVFGFDPDTGETESVPSKLVTALQRNYQIEDKRGQ